MADYTLRARFGADTVDFQRGVQVFRAGIASARGAALGFAGGAGRAAGFAQDLGRAMNDSQQFAFGFRQGLVAISNQIDGLVHGFRALQVEARATNQSLGRLVVGSLTGPAGLLVGLNLVVTLLAVFGTKMQAAFAQAAQAAEDGAKSVSVFAQALDAATDATVPLQREMARTAALFDGLGSAGRNLAVVFGLIEIGVAAAVVPFRIFNATVEAAVRVLRVFDSARRAAFGIIGDKGDGRGPLGDKDALRGRMPINIKDEPEDAAGGGRTRDTSRAEEAARLAHVMEMAAKKGRTYLDMLRATSEALDRVAAAGRMAIPPIQELVDALAGQKGLDEGGGVKGAVQDWRDLAGTMDDLAQGALLDVSSGFADLFTGGARDAKTFGAAVTQVMVDIARSIAFAAGRMLFFRGLLALFGGPAGAVAGSGVGVIGSSLGSGFGGLAQAGSSQMLGNGDVIVRLRAVDILGSQRRGLSLERAAGLSGAL